MDTPHISSASVRHISVDWSLIAITAVAVALLVGTTVRTAPVPEPASTVRSGGLEVLGPHETLIAFEDFSFGAQGWTAPATYDLDRGVGVFGPFDVGAVQKSFALPDDTSQVRLAFDLHLEDGQPSDGVSVRVNGQSVIEAASVLNAANAVVRQHADTDDYAVWILLDRPGDTVSLEVEAIPGSNAGWAIDNVSVIATHSTS